MKFLQQETVSMCSVQEKRFEMVAPRYSSRAQGSKPVVMQWPEKVLPWKPAFFSLQWNLSSTDTLGTKIIVLISKVPLLQGENNMYSYEVETQSSDLINQVLIFQLNRLKSFKP